ncbi:type II toxin-antitoxin system RelE/ParE family toxin [Rubrimonas cliftonensis]|uniref:Plasmid stabilization system protein ParE n=1 Tax=Rubrimonas cliftonensis TaxID=89524 RepID=A0A1H4EQC1_9RHOB|nr:type II toxin-antitoxin system RelE/ParE family toxin [Rubrimonas cliftonensis]SEA87201.1 Plasmid stabilization system protein ParE [Rubrimonas cliftonensis]
MSHAVRLHPAVRSDLVRIGRLIGDYAGEAAARRKLTEIRAVIEKLGEIPHRGSIRDEIAPGLRAIPAGRRAVVVFTVDDATRTVFVHAIGYAGSDWISAARSRPAR